MYPQSCLCDPAVRKDVRVKRMYSGSMRITNQVFEDAYENSNSSEFKALAKQVTTQVRSRLRPPHHCPALKNEIHLQQWSTIVIFLTAFINALLCFAPVSCSSRPSIPKVHSWPNTMLVPQFRLSGMSVKWELNRVFIIRCLPLPLYSLTFTKRIMFPFQFVCLCVR